MVKKKRNEIIGTKGYRNCNMATGSKTCFEIKIQKPECDFLH